jgi:pseudouridine synthase
MEKRLKKKIKLVKFIVSNSPFSRREIASACINNEIQINNKIVNSLAFLIDPNKDSIKIKNQLVKPQKHFYYYKFYKPNNVICSLSDPKNRPDLTKYISYALPKEIFPIGRLDRKTTGLLLFTNDGDFANKICHPKYKLKKTYHVWLDKKITKALIKKLSSGIFLADGPVQFSQIIVNTEKSLKISIHEGRNRIIRRSFSHLGFEVTNLKRISIGPILLGKVKPGEFSALKNTELKALKNNELLT